MQGIYMVLTHFCRKNKRIDSGRVRGVSFEGSTGSYISIKSHKNKIYLIAPLGYYYVDATKDFIKIKDYEYQNLK